MKNSIYKVVIVCIVMMVNQSCNDFLDVVPDDSPTLDIAFENRNTAQTYLATLYSYLPAYASPNNPALLGGDELWVNEIVQQNIFNGLPALEIAQGRQSEGNTRLSYTRGSDGTPNLYIALRDCNVLLEKIHLPFDMTDIEKRQWAAEAKVLKAYYHFWLMRMYGPIPIIRKNLPVDVSEEFAQREREPVDDVVEYIVSIIDEALEDLPLEDNGGAEVGRINRVIAASIKAKILITAASPLFNGNADFSSLVDSQNRKLINDTFDPEKWVKAAEACKQAIDLAEQAGFTLYEFKQDFIGPNSLSETTKRKLSIRGSVTEAQDNDEVIWKATGRPNLSQAFYMAKMNDPQSIISQFAHTSIQSYYSPTMRIAEMFYTKNGVPINEDPAFNYASRVNLREGDNESALNIRSGYTTAELHFEREPRFYASIGFDGGVWFGHSRFDETNTWTCEMKGGQAGGYTGNPDDNTWSVTGYLPKKMVHYESTHPAAGASFNQESYPWPVIRLADLYLLYAEALNEVQGPGAEVYKWVNRVRERAGIPDLEDAWNNHSVNPARITDKDELRKIIHTERMIELVFEGQRFWDLRRWKRAAEMMNNQRVRGWTITSGQTAGFYNVKTISQQTFNTRDYLWPIPLDNILNNPNLVQNPGW